MTTKTYITANGNLTGMNADERRYGLDNDIKITLIKNFLNHSFGFICVYLRSSLLNKILSLKTEIQNGYLALMKTDEYGCGKPETSFDFIDGNLTGMNADERRYDKTGTLSRLTTKDDLALIKADEAGCGQNETSFDFIDGNLTGMNADERRYDKTKISFDSINLYPSLSKLNDVAVSK